MGKYFKPIFMAFMLILLVDNVDALSFDEWQNRIYYSTNMSSESNTGWGVYPNFSLSNNTRAYLTRYQTYFRIDNKFSKSNSYRVEFSITNLNDSNSYDFAQSFIDDMTTRSLSCNTDSAGTVNPGSSGCFTTSTIRYSDTDYDTIKIILSFTPKVDFYNLRFSTTSQYLSQFYGPSFIKLNVHSISYTSSPSSSNDNDLDAGAIIDNNNSNTDAIIESQDKINDSLTDSNVDSNDATGFFDNFNTDDNGGISGIVTAPLNMVNSLLQTGTCSDLSFSILGKDVSLPCGSILWNRVPTAILVIYHTIICGYFSYIILKSLFKDIEKMKNPNSSEVSTLDL